MNYQARIRMDHHERAPPPGLYDRLVIDQADTVQADVTQRFNSGVRDNGVAAGSGSNAVESLQDTQRERMSGNAIAGPNTNGGAPSQYRHVYIGRNDRYTSSSASSTGGEDPDYRAFAMETYAISSPPLHPGSLTVPPASGQLSVNRPIVNSSTIRPPPGLGPLSGSNRFASARASHGMLGPHDLPVTHRLQGSDMSIDTTEVPPRNRNFVFLMSDNLQRQSWGYEESADPAESQQDGQAAIDSQERIHRATSLDQRELDAANSVQLVNAASGLRVRRLEEYSAMAREIRRSFAAGEVDPRQTRDFEIALDFAEGVVAASARQSDVDNGGHVAEREFSANQARAVEAERQFNENLIRRTEDAAVRRYVAQLAATRARHRAQLARERENAVWQQRILGEDQAPRDMRRMNGFGFSQAGIIVEDQAHREARERAESHREPSAAEGHTETQRYGSFDDFFFYDTPSEMPAYRPDQQPPRPTHLHYMVPPRGSPTYGGNNGASRAGEHLGHHEGGRSDQRYDHSDARAVQDIRYEQPADRYPWDITQWVDTQASQVRINGAVLQARPSNEGNELLDEEHGETLSNENGEYRGDGYNEGLVAQRQGLRVTEYGEDWESVTFVGSDEEVNVEGDDEPDHVGAHDEQEEVDADDDSSGVW